MNDQKDNGTQKQQSEVPNRPGENSGDRKSVWQRLSAQVEKHTTAIALIAAFCALPGAAKDLYDLIDRALSKPDTKLHQVDEMALSFDPLSKSIKFEFDFKIKNSGSEEDAIVEATAELDAPSTPSNPLITIDNREILFYENGEALKKPFAVTKGWSGPFLCVIESYISDVKRQSLEQTGAFKLIVKLTGDDGKTHIKRFCFDLTDDNVNDLFRSGAKMAKAFLYPEC
jgi:hypothetical protein